MIDSIDSHINNKISDNDRSKTNSTKAYTDSKVGENDGFANNRSKTVVPENMVENDSVNEVITYREVRVDENEVVVATLAHLLSIVQLQKFPEI